MQEFDRAKMAGTLPHQGTEGPVDCIAVKRDHRRPFVVGMSAGLEEKSFAGLRIRSEVYNWPEILMPPITS